MSKSDGDESQRALRMVEFGLKLDSDNRDEDAYVQYLKSVEFIASILGRNPIQVANSSTVTRTKKLLSVARLCIDRSEALVDKFKNVTKPADNFLANSLNADCLTAPVPCCTNGSVQLPLLMSAKDKKPSIPSTCVSCYSLSDLTGDSPLELHTAYKENRQLERVYKDRMARATSAFARSNLSLELGRRIAENVQLARSRDGLRVRQMQEQHQRLLRQAEKKISMAGSLSEEEQTKKQVFADILQYHQHQRWPSVIKQVLDRDSFGQDSVQAAVNRTLSTTEHPLCKLLIKLRSDVRCEIQTLTDRMSLQRTPEAKKATLNDHHHNDENGDISSLVQKLQKTDVGVSNMGLHHQATVPSGLVEVIRKVRTATKLLEDLLVLTYDGEGTNTGHDVWKPFVEDVFFTGLWEPLLSVFRLVNREEEWCLKQVMTVLLNKTPNELGVNAELCNVEKLKEVAGQLCAIGRMHSPLRKLSCLVTVARVLCEDPIFSRKSSDEMHSIGADDLIPMLAYVVIQSQFVSLITECHALEELVSESCLLGEEGYCLTSIQTAVHYLNTLVQMPPSHRRQHST